MEEYDHPNTMLCVEGEFSGVSRIGKEASNAGDHYVSIALRHRHNQTPVTAFDIRELKLLWKPMLAKTSEYLQTYSNDDKRRYAAAFLHKGNLVDASTVDMDQRCSFNLQVRTENKKNVVALKKQGCKRAGEKGDTDGGFTRQSETEKAQERGEDNDEDDENDLADVLVVESCASPACSSLEAAPAKAHEGSSSMTSSRKEKRKRPSTEEESEEEDGEADKGHRARMTLLLGALTQTLSLNLLDITSILTPQNPNPSPNPNPNPNPKGCLKERRT